MTELHTLTASQARVLLSRREISAAERQPEDEAALSEAGAISRSAEKVQITLRECFPRVADIAGDLDADEGIHDGTKLRLRSLGPDDECVAKVED